MQRALMQILWLLDMADRKFCCFSFLCFRGRLVCNRSSKYGIANAALGNQILYYVPKECVKKTGSMWFWLNCLRLCSVQEIGRTTSGVIIAYKFVMVLIARMVILAANWFIAYLGHQHTRPMILSSHTHTVGVAAWYLGSCLRECRDIYKRVSLTAETDWDYWTFTGQCLMEAELDFNELLFTPTGVVYFVVWYRRCS